MSGPGPHPWRLTLAGVLRTASASGPRCAWRSSTLFTVGAAALTLALVIELAARVAGRNPI